MSKLEKSPLDPLSETELLAGLGASGYPLEIRLLKAFTDGGMDPIIGFRVSSEPGESREVDIIAHFTEHVLLGRGLHIRVTLRLLIEAKSLEPGAAFVGFPWQRPSDHDLRVYRMHFGGAPSNRVIPELARDNEAVIGVDSLSEAFDPMNVSPFCVQWSVVRRTKAGGSQRPVATHDDAFWKGIDGVVNASHHLMLEHTTYRWPEKTYMLLFELPVLVIATPHLWLADAADSVRPLLLTTTQSLMLGRTFQVDDHVEHRVVDVVTESSIPALVAACRSAVDTLKARVARHSETLIQTADRQRVDLDMLLLEQLAADRRRSAR